MVYSLMLNSIALLALAGYLGTVAYQGNLSDLGDLLVSDKGYLKWILALAIIIACVKNPDTKDIGEPLLSAAMLALCFKVVANSGLQSSFKTAISNL